MPIIILLAILALLVSLLVYKKLNSSPKFDAFVKGVTEEQDIREPKAGEVIKKIGAAEEALKHKAEADKKQAERLQKDADAVGKFLTDRGVVKTEKGKEAEDDMK